MKKRIILFLSTIFVLLLVCMILVGFKISSLTVDIADFKLNSINGARSQNSLVLYTADSKGNEFGYELLVEVLTGAVIDADTKVEGRFGAYVLSGHGEAADFLREAEIGDIIAYKSGLVVLRHNTILSSLKKIKVEKDQVDEIAEYKEENLYDIDTLAISKMDEKINGATEELITYFLLSEIKDDEAQEKTDELLSLIDEKYALTLEDRAVEGRGIWHRPNATSIDESTLEGVKQLAHELSDLGINTLYVETFWQGMTTYYSDVLEGQHPSMASYDYDEYGNDYMLALISECHKEGIEVHAWVEVLNAGISGYDTPAHIKKEWLCADLDGNTSSNYLDPTNPEVQTLTYALIDEMLTKYDLDGVSLDYIRYDETTNYGEYIDCGFTENSIALFKSAYGYNGDSLTEDLRADTEIRSEWHEFKTEAITNLVSNASKTVRENHKNAIISASPYGYISEAKETYMQDIQAWLEKGYLDVILPMIYTESESVLSEAAAKYAPYGNKTLQFIGISPLYNGESVKKNQELVEKIRILSLSGASFFATQNYIEDSSTEALEIKSGIGAFYKSAAVSPTDAYTKVLSAWRVEFADRYERLYREKMTDDERKIVEDFLITAERKATTIDINEAISLVEDLNSKAQGFSNTAVKNRITEQTEYIICILQAALHREQLRNN